MDESKFRTLSDLLRPQSSQPWKGLLKLKCNDSSVNNDDSPPPQIYDSHNDDLHNTAITYSYSCRVQIPMTVQWYTWEYRWQYMVICLRVLAMALDPVASCFFTELFFPLGALWRFSVVSPARHAFGCSRLSENEISLFFFFLFCLCMLRAGSSDWCCGASVSQCLTGWDRLVSGHRPHQSRSAGCVFISENKIPLQCNGVRRTRKVEGIKEKKSALMYFCGFPLSRCPEGDVRRLPCKH